VLIAGHGARHAVGPLRALAGLSTADGTAMLQVEQHPELL